MIDTWYQSNMTEYTEKIEDTIWCNDRSVVKTVNRITYFGGYDRTYTNYIPSLECINAEDKLTVDTKNGKWIINLSSSTFNSR